MARATNLSSKIFAFNTVICYAVNNRYVKLVHSHG